MAVRVINLYLKPGRRQLSVLSLLTRSWKGPCFLLESTSLPYSLGLPPQSAAPQAASPGATEMPWSAPVLGLQPHHKGRWPSKHCSGWDHAQTTAPEPTAACAKHGKVLGQSEQKDLKPLNSNNLPCTTDQLLSSATYPCFIQSVLM